MANEVSATRFFVLQNVVVRQNGQITEWRELVFVWYQQAKQMSSPESQFKSVQEIIKEINNVLTALKNS